MSIPDLLTTTLLRRLTRYSKGSPDWVAQKILLLNHLCGLYFPGNHAPDTAAVAALLDDLGIRDLTDYDVVRGWHFRHLNESPVYDVVCELAGDIRPTADMARQAIALHVAKLASELQDGIKASSVSQGQVVEFYTQNIATLEALTESDVLTAWDTCSLYGLPPFPQADQRRSN